MMNTYEVQLIPMDADYPHGDKVTLRVTADGIYRATDEAIKSFRVTEYRKRPVVYQVNMVK